MTTHAAAAGDIVTARPWISGYETAPRKGIVLGTDGDYLVVWFRGLGDLARDESGHAIQAILRCKADVAGHVAQYSDRALVTVAKTVRDCGVHAAGPLFGVLCNAVRDRSLA
jgi:hypothetical protein